MKPKTLFTVVFCLSLLLPGALPAAQDPSAKLLADNGNAVLSIVVLDKDKKEIGRGSAVVLSETTAVTTYHLVSKAAQITALNSQKKEVDVEGILAVDKTLDLALLQIDGKVKFLLGGAALAADLPVVAIGANESGVLASAEGKIRRLFDVTPNVKVADSTLAVAETFDGGAVLDGTGKLAGLLNVFERRLRFVVPASVLIAMKPGELVKMKAWTPEDYMETVEAGWLSGRMFMWIDENYAAVRGLDRVVKAQPANLEAWKYLANVYDRQRDYGKALEAYQKVAALDPANAAAFAGIGMIQSRTSKYAEAIPNLEKALQLDSSMVSVYKSLGETYEGLREFAKAGDAYDKYLASNPPDRAQVYRQLGNVRSNAEQFALAAAAYGEFLKINPDDAYQYYQMAQMLEKAGKFEEAEAVFIKTGEMAKDPGKYFPNIVTMYDTAKLTDKAIAACQKWIAVAPNNRETHYSLGLQYQKLNKNAEAIAAFQKAVEVDPKYDFGWFQIGYGYYMLKNYAKAVPAFQKNVELVPDHLYGWMYLGMSQMQLKQFKAALDAMEKAVAIKPDNTDALMNLGVIYLNLHDKISAQDIVKKLEALDPAKAAKLKSYIK